MRFLSLGLLLIVAACSSPETATTDTLPVSPPAAVVAQWIEALDTGDVATIGSIVETQGVAVAAAVENGLDARQLDALLKDGMPEGLATDYWRSFTNGFATFRGLPIGTTTVRAQTPLSAAGVDFTAVDVSSGEGEGEVIVRLVDGRWRVDLIATVGSALVGPLGSYLFGVVEGPDAAGVVGAYKSYVVPALTAASARHPEDRRLEFELEFIVQLIAQNEP